MALDGDARNGNTLSANALTMAALIAPEALSDVILRVVHASMPMSKQEIEKRKSELPIEIDALSYSVAAAMDRAGELPDPRMSPMHVLGVRVKESDAGDEQGVHVDTKTIRTDGEVR